MTNHEVPTSEWEHSHAIEAGDELTDTNTGAEITVDEVHDDGSVTVRTWRDQRHGQEYHEETFDEEEVRVALADGIFETEDGLSNELASY